MTHRAEWSNLGVDPMASPPENAGARVRFPPPLVFVGCLLAGVGLRYAVPPPTLPLAMMVSVAIGIAVLAAGLGLVASARSLFVRTGQNPAPWAPSPELILSGPYRFTRNPMYVGLTLIVFGLGVALNNVWIMLFAGVALVIVHVIAVLPEERYLSEKFGAAYDGYRRQVRRYL
jgi:protein-S-isoprenylcysteine O-methyltransferase Ste14